MIHAASSIDERLFVVTPFGVKHTNLEVIAPLILFNIKFAIRALLRLLYFFNYIRPFVVSFYFEVWVQRMFDRFFLDHFLVLSDCLLNSDR